jgi:hypothetical protein
MIHKIRIILLQVLILFICCQMAGCSGRAARARDGAAIGIMSGGAVGGLSMMVANRNRGIIAVPAGLAGAVVGAIVGAVTGGAIGAATYHKPEPLPAQQTAYEDRK